MTATIGIGLIGAGSFGRTLAEVCVTIPEFNVAAVCDVVEDRARHIADAHGAMLCASVEDLLQQTGVDAVIIASSHDMHHPNALASARAGKHIFCEKPMAIDVTQCQEMIEAAQTNQVKLLIGHVMRLFPSMQRLYQLLESGVFGRPLAMKMLRSAWVERLGWWARSSQSGGMMHSSGAHMYDLMGSILGHPRSVYAVAAPRIQMQTDFDDTIFTTVTYENGAIGTVDVSISGEAWVYGGGVIAEQGTLHFQFTHDVSWLEYKLRDQPPVRETFGTFDQEGLNGVVVELQNFRDMILHDAKPFVDNDAAMEAVALIQCAYQSVDTGHVIHLRPAASTEHSNRVG